MASNDGSKNISYTVQPGDTFWELAYRYNTTVEAIMAANPGVDFNNLMVGQVIAIPDPPPMHGPQHGRPEYEHQDYRRPYYPHPYPYPYPYPFPYLYPFYPFHPYPIYPPIYPPRYR